MMTEKEIALKLKPCPFCGSKEIKTELYHGDIKLSCMRCNIFILNPKPWYDWNTRPIEDFIRLELSAARAERDNNRALANGLEDERDRLREALRAKNLKSEI